MRALLKASVLAASLIAIGGCTFIGDKDEPVEKAGKHTANAIIVAAFMRAFFNK